MRRAHRSGCFGGAVGLLTGWIVRRLKNAWNHNGIHYHLLSFQEISVTIAVRSTVLSGFMNVARDTAATKPSNARFAILDGIQGMAKPWRKNPLQQANDIVPTASLRTSTREKLAMIPVTAYGVSWSTTPQTRRPNRARFKDGSAQKRGIVTPAMMNDLGEINNFLIKLPKKLAPYQKPELCEFHAQDIVLQTHEVRRAQAARSSGIEEKIVSNPSGELWQRLKKVFRGSVFLDEVRMTSADQLLEIYQTYGPFVLRGPKLDDPRQDAGYGDHAIAIMAAVKVPVDIDCEKIVLSALDCNDRGIDKQTKAARQDADQLDKQLYELTHAQANEHGADRRRIRLIDAGSVVDRLWLHTDDLIAGALSKDKSELIPNILPKVFFMPQGAPLLTEEQTRQLGNLVKNNWSEVEDYTDENNAGSAS